MMCRFLVLALALSLTAAFSPTSSRPISTRTRRATTVVLKEAAAKAAWLAKLDVPVTQTQDVTTQAPVQVAVPAKASESEIAAKIAWLSKLDHPSSRPGG